MEAKATASHIKQVASDPISGPNQSDETSENIPPTKQMEVETTIFQVKIKELQEVFKWTQTTSATLQEEIWS